MSARSYKSFPVLVRSGFRALGLEVSRYRPRGKEKLPRAVSEHFKTLYQKYCDHSMVKWSGLYNTFNATEHVSRQKIEGAIVECGVWEGGCSAIMAELLKDLGDTSRDFYMYDTFEGMSEPTDKDFSFATNLTAKDLYKTYQKDGKPDWSVGALEKVQEVMAKTGYPSDKIKTIKGKVEDTIPKTMPDKIAVLRLDTDWYESTKHEMEHLFPRLVKGGILIIDDYGAWAGAKDAVDEYFAKHPHNIYFQFDPLMGSISGIKQ